MTNYKIKKPILSVYMPVFNAAPYLSESIESILNQTLANFEFIIIDDHSTDNSWKINQILRPSRSPDPYLPQSSKFGCFY